LEGNLDPKIVEYEEEIASLKKELALLRGIKGENTSGTETSEKSIEQELNHIEEDSEISKDNT